LAYLHAHKKIHRDLKSANLLMQQDGTLKLADFGVAGELSATVSRRHTMIGSPYWMSPEVIEDTGHDQKADIWSLGITIIELAEIDPPHFEIGPMRVVFFIPNNPPPELKHKEDYSPALSELIARCLVKDPEQRASAEELLQMPYVMEAENCRNAFTCAMDDVEGNAMKEDSLKDNLEPCSLEVIARQAAVSSPVAVRAHGARDMPIDELTSPTSAAKSSAVLRALSDLEAFSAPGVGVSIRCTECLNCPELKKRVAELERRFRNCRRSVLRSLRRQLG